MDKVAGKRILLTGGSGFLGAPVRERLVQGGAAEVFSPRSAEYDLRDRDAIRQVLSDTRPDMVVHLAAVVGGIGANMATPGQFFYDNAIMGIQLIEESRLSRGRALRLRRHRLRLPQARPGALPRGGPLERLPGGDQRPLRPGEEDAAGPAAGLPAAVRLRRRLPAPGQPLRTLATTSTNGPRTSFPRSSRSPSTRWRATRRRSSAGAPGVPRASSSTSTTRRRESSRPPQATRAESP